MAFIPSSGSIAAWLQSDNASVITVGSGSVFAVVQGLQGASVSGTVIANQGTSPWIITGSVQASLTPAANQSVSGTVGASLIGLSPVSVSNFPTTQNISGSVVAFINNTPAVSVQGTVFVSGSVITVGTAVPNQSVSGTVGASIIGTVPVTQATNPWTVTSSIAGGIFPISGSVAATIVGTPNVNVAGSVVAFQGAGWSGSVAATVTNTNLNVSGSVAAWLQSSNASIITVGTAAPNQSVSGTVQTDVRGSVATVIIGGSIAASFTPPANQSVSGTVQTQVQASVAVVIIGGSILTSSTANQSVSGTVGASIIGAVPVIQSGAWTQSVVGTVFVAGSVAAILTGTVNQSVSGTVGASIIGSVGVNQGAAASLLAGWPIINGEAGDVTGTFTNATQTTSVTANTLDGYGNSLISITGTYGTATAIFEGSDDGGTTWFTVSAARDDTNVIETGYTSLTNVLRSWQINNSGFDSIRVRSTAVTSGTVNVRISSSAAPNSSGATVAIGAALPAGTNLIGAVNASITGTVIASVSGSVGIVGNPSISGTVLITNTPSISGTVLVNNGSVVAFQGTSPWVVNFQNSSIIALQAGSVVSINQGSIAAAQIGTTITSIVGSFLEDSASTNADPGVFVLGVRNDTLSSITSTDGDYTQHTVGPAGETIIANAPYTKWIQGSTSVFGATSVAVLAAQGASIFTYITGLQVVNASANNVYVTLGTGSNSILGYTVAPANGGSNIYFPNAIKTTQNGTFTASINGVASVFLSAQGFTSKT